MDNVTCDLSKFGYRELSEASILLKLYSENPVDFLSDEITLNFNPNSGVVFLSDEDYNVAIEEDGKLVQFFSCRQGGNEGTQAESDYDFEKYNGYCSESCHEANN